MAENRYVRAKCRLAAWAALAIFTLGSTVVEGADVKVVFDHLTTNADRSYQIAELASGDRLIVEIQNTHPTQFTYKLSGVTPAKTGQAAAAAVAGDTKLETVRLEEVHSPEFGTYIVKVELREKSPGVLYTGDIIRNSATVRLRPVTLIVNVESPPTWNLAFAGGFTGSDLTDPVFALQKQTDNAGVETDVIVEQKDDEDEARLGLGAFLHLFHERKPQWAWSFGIGVQERGATSYYLGPTYRFGDKGALTAGVVWAAIDRLPGGARVGSPPPDTNTLSNLASKIDEGFFVAMSYSFADLKDFLGKAKEVKLPAAGTPGVAQ